MIMTMHISHRNTRLFSLFISAIISLCFCENISAQFYTNGADPGFVKWSTVSTQNFKLIYPVGLDSLAREYGKALEKWYSPVGGSIGYRPNQQYKRPVPVILHAYNATANGSVAWAPRRMDLYTVMDAYSSESMPWITNLAIHESRHLSQMQFGKDGFLKVGHWIVGEMWTGALSAAYPNQAFLEGDAVTAETALTKSGRGRSADFLEWYRVSFDKGDMRNYYQWRYGSQKKYTPNHYTIGYLSIAGTRYTYDAPSFTDRYFERVTHGFPIRFNNFQKTIKEYSGKRLAKSFSEIESSFKNIWEEEDRNRLAPISVTRLTEQSKRYTTYLDGTFVHDNFIAVKSSLTQPSTLVLITPEGNEYKLHSFSGGTSKLAFSPTTQRIYWSENIKDPRWDLSMKSLIRYLDNNGKKIKNLTTDGRFYNPSVSADGLRLSAVNYPIEGGSSIVILDAQTGDVLYQIDSPRKDIQLVETAWFKTAIFASGISEEGYGIYKFSDDKWITVLTPNPSKIKNLQSYENGIAFTCDMTGVNEIYSYSDGNLSQLTSTKYGASDFAIKDNEIFFANLDSDGKSIVKTSLTPVVQNLTYSAHTYPIADKLSTQEKTLGTASLFRDATFSDVKRYRKVPHLPHIHSWSPIYFNYNNIDDLSFDYTYEDVSLGATLLFQNNLSTLQGSLGYSLHQDSYNSEIWRNSLHLNLLYEGLYPVFELNVSFNDRDHIQYGWKEVNYGDDHKVTLKGSLIPQPAVNGDLKVYVPLSFSNGGWQRGIVPQINYSFSNDYFNTSKISTNYNYFFDNGGFQNFTGATEGKNILRQSATVSLRGYVIRPKTSSTIYSRLGVGFEAGYRTRFGVSDVYNSNAYFYTYGYLPGIHPTHSIKVTAITQQQIGDGLYRENAIKTMPRGFANSSLTSYLGTYEKNQAKITVDYAMPVLPVDWTFLCPWFYIRNFEVIPHADFSPISKGSIYTVGTDLNVHLGNFLWLPYDTTAGISINFNGGSAYNALSGIVADLSKSYIGFHMNVDL